MAKLGCSLNHLQKFKICECLDLPHLAEVGRELWRSAGPTALLELVAQDCVQTAFMYLQDGDSTVSEGNLCQGSNTSIKHN